MILSGISQGIDSPAEVLYLRKLDGGLARRWTTMEVDDVVVLYDTLLAQG